MNETPTLSKILAGFTRQRIETETALARLSEEDRAFLQAEEVLLKHLCPPPNLIGTTETVGLPPWHAARQAEQRPEEVATPSEPGTLTNPI